MQSKHSGLSRRRFLKSAIIATTGYAIVGACNAQSEVSKAVTLFDGKTFDGWIQVQNSTTSFGGADIIDLTALANKLKEKPDGVAAFLTAQLDDTAKADLAAFSSSSTDAKELRSALARNIKKLIYGNCLYDPARFESVAIRPATQALLANEPHGRELVRLNRMLLEDAFPSEVAKSIPTGWIVQDGTMASTGAGRGVIYTEADYSRFRLFFSVRHAYGNPDHAACVLFFCTRPQSDNVPLDALGGIQFQVPTGGHWDYRPGRNDAGGEEFTRIAKPVVDQHEWSRIELLVDASKGEARLAVAQPLSSPAIEVARFKDPAAGRAGPVALQMHNGGLFDEYKELAIEIDPPVDDLITVR